MSRCLAPLVGALSICALSIPSTGAACIHEVARVEYDAVAGVARAERMLSRGDALGAYRAARRARRTLQRRDPDPGAEAEIAALVRRAVRVTAVAVVRLGGWTPVSDRVARSHVLRGRQERSLRWALGELRAQHRALPGDLRLEAQLAEALARFPEHRDEARRMLTRLAERDLMPDAHGYAALARLVPPGGEEWDRALRRCGQMAAEQASRICPAESVDPS